MRTCFPTISILVLSTAQGIVAADKCHVIRNEQGQVVAAEYFGEVGELHRTRLHEFPHLECLTIVYGATLTTADIDYLAQLTQLIELHMGFSGVDLESVTINGTLSPLTGLKSLEVFTLCKENMKDDDLTFLASLPKITYVEFNARNGATPGKPHGVTDKTADIVAKAKSLRDICICGEGDFSDRFVAAIAQGLPQLEHLEVASDRLTDESLRLIARQLRELKWLNIQSNNFTDGGVRHLQDLRTLEMLWMQSESLNGACAKSVGGLTRLKHLQLTVSAIDDKGFAAIAGLPQLEILALRKPELTDTQFLMLRNHRRLQTAFLNGARLTPDVAGDVVRSIPNLDYLSVGSSNEALRTIVGRELRRKANGSTPGKQPSAGSSQED